MMSLSDLGEYLQEAVRSRIIDRIEFQVPNPLELKKYLEELLNAETYRLQEIIEGGNKFTPFTSDVIDMIIEKLGDASLRKYNEVFSMLIETAVYYEVEQIDSEYFEKVKDEIMIWE